MWAQFSFLPFPWLHSLFFFSFPLLFNSKNEASCFAEGLLSHASYRSGFFPASFAKQALDCDSFFPKSLLLLAAQPVPPTLLPVHKCRSLPGTAIHLLKDMKDASLSPVFLLLPPHPSFQPSKLNSQVIKKKADMGGTGFFGFVFKTLPYLWGIYSGVGFSIPFFPSLVICSVLGMWHWPPAAELSTFALFPALSIRALQLIENPLILSVPYQIKTSLQVTFQISAASP